MKTVDELAREIVKREGGYVNDPDDPGGPTKYGVTLKTLKNLRQDINKNGVVDIKDVKSLTFNEAVQIYKIFYFEKPNMSELPSSIQASVFDMYVNAGRASVQILQRLLLRFGETVDVDGIIGPQTVRAARRVEDKAPNHLADAYGISRRNYYYRLADRRSKSRKYAKARNGKKGGWIKRAEEFIHARFHYSAKDHAERTRKWG